MNIHIKLNNSYELALKTIWGFTLYLSTISALRNIHLLFKIVKNFNIMSHIEKLCYMSHYPSMQERKQKKKKRGLLLVYESEKNYFLPNSNLFLAIKEKN